MSPRGSREIAETRDSRSRLGCLYVRGGRIPFAAGRGASLLNTAFNTVGYGAPPSAGCPALAAMPDPRGLVPSASARAIVVFGVPPGPRARVLRRALRRRAIIPGRRRRASTHRAIVFRQFCEHDTSGFGGLLNEFPSPSTVPPSAVHTTLWLSVLLSASIPPFLRPCRYSRVHQNTRSSKVTTAISTIRTCHTQVSLSLPNVTPALLRSVHQQSAHHGPLRYRDFSGRCRGSRSSRGANEPKLEVVPCLRSFIEPKLSTAGGKPNHHSRRFHRRDSCGVR